VQELELQSFQTAVAAAREQVEELENDNTMTANLEQTGKHDPVSLLQLAEVVSLRAGLARAVYIHHL
jgi:hypothetical protein